MKRVGRIFGIAAASICALGTVTSCNKTGFKVGLLCLHGQTSTYDNNFINAFENVCKKPVEEGGLGLDPSQYDIRTDVAEDYNEIYTAAKEWAEDGYSMVFADSFGHQYGLIDVAKEYPDTEFCHATGTNALKNGEMVLPNYHTAFASIFQGRYLAGYAAGLKMIEDIDAKKYKLSEANIGYVGAWPYAEVISGYTSFYLGVCHAFDQKYNVDGKADPLTYRPTMYVTYTSSWYDYSAEKEASLALINSKKCKLISQHADSMGSPQSCAAKFTPNVCYNISTKVKTPDTYLYGTKINWEPYFQKIIKTCKDKYDGKEVDPIPADFTGILDDGSVEMLEYGNIASSAIQQKVEAEKRIVQAAGASTDYIFDCRNFTVSAANNAFAFYGDPENGIEPFLKLEEGKTEHAHVISYKADVDDDGTYSHETEVILNTGENDDEPHDYFAESFYRSAPYFDLIIDGIVVL